MPARTIWTGAISFGLVNIPVKMSSAVSEKNVRFNQLNSKTGARIKQKRVDPSTDSEVAFEDIVKGYEISPDRYVTITPEELESAAPKATHSVDIEKFVDQEQIDPLIYASTYYFGPDSIAAAKPYQMLVKAMQDSGKVAIGRMVMRSKERLVAMRASDDGRLVVSMLVWADEVQSTANVEVDTSNEPSEREVGMAAMLIDSLSGDFDHSEYADSYREKVLTMIEAKAAGETIEVPEQVEDDAPAPDLLAALEASLGAAGTKKASKKTRKKVAA